MFFFFFVKHSIVDHLGKKPEVGRVFWAKTVSAHSEGILFNFPPFSED